MESGMPAPPGTDGDKDVKKYFMKVLHSLSWGLIWLIFVITAGIYNELAFTGGKPILYNILFYLFFIISLASLIYYYYKTWKNNGK
jgi:hypothetical protein